MTERLLYRKHIQQDDFEIKGCNMSRLQDFLKHIEMETNKPILLYRNTEEKYEQDVRKREY